MKTVVPIVMSLFSRGHPSVNQHRCDMGHGFHMSTRLYTIWYGWMPWNPVKSHSIPLKCSFFNGAKSQISSCDPLDACPAWSFLVAEASQQQNCRAPGRGTDVRNASRHVRRTNLEAVRWGTAGAEAWFIQIYLSMDWLKGFFLLESPMFYRKICGFQIRFSLKPIHWMFDN